MDEIHGLLEQRDYSLTSGDSQDNKLSEIGYI